MCLKLKISVLLIERVKFKTYCGHFTSSVVLDADLMFTLIDIFNFALGEFVTAQV